jgi:flagellin-like protein
MDKRWYHANRGVPPTVGVVLLVAIAVLLAATAGAFFFGAGQQATWNQMPTVALDASFDRDGGSHTLTVTHEGGNTVAYSTVRVFVRDATCVNGNDPNAEYTPGGLGHSDDRVAAGSVLKLDNWTLCRTLSTDLDLSQAEVRVVWVSEDGATSATLWRWRGPGA